MISATFSVSRSNSSKAPSFQIFAEVRTPHCRNARKPAAADHRSPPPNAHWSTARRSRRSPHDACRSPESPPVVATFQSPDHLKPLLYQNSKSAGCDFHSSRLQQAAVQSPVGKFTVLFFLILYFSK
nr:hypothetical protein Iba_chr03bCG2960 [Ipomoea batatas]